MRRLVGQEGTRTPMPAVQEVIEQQGIFRALYSDRAHHFFVTPKTGGKVDEKPSDASWDMGSKSWGSR
jgi:hypothetical protein